MIGNNFVFWKVKDYQNKKIAVNYSNGRGKMDIFKKYYRIYQIFNKSLYRFGIKKADKLDLGGIGRGENGWVTVNLASSTDIREDILNINNYCRDNTVEEFLMSHTYEHIPIVKMEVFLNKILKKLKKRGKLTIIQTDIKKVIDLYKEEKIDFYCLRDIIFSPIDKRKLSHDITGKDLQHHQFMWGSEELKKELISYGFSEVKVFDAGFWKFDVSSVGSFQKNEKYFNVEIPNLGIEAYK